MIIGAGPCGLLLAHYLLRRGDRYQVEIYERLGDPTKVALSDSRTIPYSLNERGLGALRPIEGLEEAMQTAGVENWKIVRHKAKGKIQLLPRRQQATVDIDRIRVVKTLLSSLVAMAEGSGRLKLHFNYKCIGVDFPRQTLLLESVSPEATAELQPLLVHYDRLVGADGARSTVRSQFLKTQSFDFEQTRYRSCYKTLFFPSKNDETGYELQPQGFHVWQPEEGITLIAGPQQSGGYVGVIFAPRNRQDILNFQSLTQVKEFFRQYFPEASLLLTDTEAEALVKRPISSQLKIRCSRYHHEDRVLLIGDAAHAVGSSATGQGCNAALEDAQIFARLLDEWEDSWEIALAKFTEERQPDAHALGELDGNIIPISQILFAEFILRERWAKIAHRWFPQLVAPPLRELMNSNTPYAEILNKYRRWVAKVKASNLKFD
ncbi:MAG: FAD-dependent monooxygenase [Symploca sp. SIO2E6]|nr:FAD-dependent monooxygenase [Symploca sp. SIO2E6]